MRKDTLKMRWAQPSDSAIIAKIALASSKLEHRLKPFPLDEAGLADLWLRRIKYMSYKVILAYGDIEGVYGFLCFGGDIRPGDVKALYIAPEYIRQGVGQYLIRTAAELVKARHGHKLTVDVEMLNYGAQEFYRSLQFGAKSVKLGHLIVMVKEF